VIDFTTNERANGINPDSRSQIGTFGSFSPVDALKTELNSAYNDPAFNIVNQTSQTQQVRMSFDGPANNCLLAMQMTPDEGRSDRDLLLAADDDTSVAPEGRSQISDILPRVKSWVFSPNLYRYRASTYSKVIDC
jgi:hypothetical protein